MQYLNQGISSQMLHAVKLDGLGREVVLFSKKKHDTVSCVMAFGGLDNQIKVQVHR